MCDDLTWSASLSKGLFWLHPIVLHWDSLYHSTEGAVWLIHKGFYLLQDAILYKTSQVCWPFRMLIRAKNYDQEPRRLNSPQILQLLLWVPSSLCLSLFRVAWSGCPDLGLFMTPLQMSMCWWHRLSYYSHEKSTENKCTSLSITHLGFLFQSQFPIKYG